MNSFNAIITDAELTFNREWSMNDTLMQDDEELSATSNEEANKVFAEWKADDELDEIMEIDEQIGSTLLDDAIFSDEPCLSPTGPLEELVYTTMEEEDQDRFFVPLLDDIGNDKNTTKKLEPKKISSASQDPFSAHLVKLAESMKRSQETRKSLTLETPKTKKYDRTSTVNGVLTSVEKSSLQLQYYLEKNHHHQRIM